jgi:hypothetical protein
MKKGDVIEYGWDDKIGLAVVDSICGRDATIRYQVIEYGRRMQNMTHRYKIINIPSYYKTHSNTYQYYKYKLISFFHDIYDFIYTDDEPLFNIIFIGFVSILLDMVVYMIFDLFVVSLG